MQERIVFNEDMGGRYESVVDLSQLMALGAQGRPASVDKKKEKMDTLVVFNDFLETYKDSIATLPVAKQEDIKALRDFSMQMNIDEDKTFIYSQLPYLKNKGLESTSFLKLYRISAVNFLLFYRNLNKRTIRHFLLNLNFSVFACLLLRFFY